jgi:hypothetical protein
VIEKRHETIEENPLNTLNVENVQKIEFHSLAIHEVMHGWFHDRLEKEPRIVEPFCTLVGQIITDSPAYEGNQTRISPPYIRFYETSTPASPYYLLRLLYELGMDDDKAIYLLTNTAKAAKAKEQPLSKFEFALLTSQVLYVDISAILAAFQAAGISL